MSESDRLSGESEVQSQTVWWNFVDVGVESGEEPLERGGGSWTPPPPLGFGTVGSKRVSPLDRPQCMCCVGCVLVLMKWMGMLKANRVAIHPRV